mgnify:CR=1 FL=1
MKKPFRPSAACYALVLYHPQAQAVEVGALGTINCPAGWLYYVGRARRGWSRRIKRFQKENMTPFWHIDYLVQAPSTSLTSVFVFSEPAEVECTVAREFEKFSELQALPHRFGASDCEQGCRAHGWSGELAPERLHRRLRSDPLEFSGRVDFHELSCDWFSRE